MGGWCGSFAKKNDPDNYIYCRITVLFTAGNPDNANCYWATGGSAVFNAEEGNWQFASAGIVAPNNCTYIPVSYTHLDVYKRQGCNCGYGYDDNGNIASATLNGKWTGYTYDELGQLMQVNDHSDTRPGENGTTWKYTYDLGGNILKKERFAYADTTTPLETVTYTYGDANWRDKDVYKRQVLGRASMRASGGNYHSSGLRGTGGQSRIFEEGANV